MKIKRVVQTSKLQICWKKPMGEKKDRRKDPGRQKDRQRWERKVRVRLVTKQTCHVKVCPWGRGGGGGEEEEIQIDKCGKKEIHTIVRQDKKKTVIPSTPVHTILQFNTTMQEFYSHMTTVLRLVY